MRNSIGRSLSDGLLSFRVMFRVFLLRIVDVELLSADGDTLKLLGQFASVLAAISFVLTVWLVFAGRVPPEGLWSMEHLLISTTMLVVGVFAVLSWDTTFPDRRDILVLGPLPVRIGILFSAKLSALMATLGLSIVALNSISGVIWPLLFIPAEEGVPGVFRSMFAYWAVMAAAGLFVFCTVLSVQWLAGQMLPRQVFLRFSPVLQVGLLGLFAETYFLEPSLASPSAISAPANQVILRYLPTYWFFGLFQQLNGWGDPTFHFLAVRAWIGLGVIVSAATVFVLLAYGRNLRLIVEEPEIVPGAKRGSALPLFGHGLQSAILLFSVRTFARSRKHRFLLSLYLGIGFGMMAATLKAPMSVSSADASATVTRNIAATLLTMCFVIFGVRAGFALPITLKANWIFQTTERCVPGVYGRTTRRALLMLGYCPALVALTVWTFATQGWREAAEHVLILAVVGGIVSEVSFYGFDKLPFACSYLPGKGNVPAYFWGFLLLLLPATNQFAAFELSALRDGKRYWMMVGCLVAIWSVVRWRSSAQLDSLKALRYEEEAAAELVGLGLHRSTGAVVKDTAG